MDTNIKSPAVYNSAPQNQAAPVSASKTEENKQKKENKKDIYNDTPLRKLGFLDEYGPALRPVLSA